MKRKLIKLSVRVDKATLEDLKRILGEVDTSKIIRASMNCTKNVTLGLFGGELRNSFKRRKDNEEISLYDNFV